MLKDKKSIFLIFFILICIITLTFTNAMNIINNITQVETLYRENFKNLDTLCDHPKEKKLGICWEVLHSVTSLNLGFSFYPYYFNKNAASTESFACQSRVIKLTSAPNKDKFTFEFQDMVPCYARHNPMRTGPLVDDYYNYIFITGGHYDDSLFVFICNQESYSECFVRRFLENVSINNLPNKSPFSPEELEEELQTLKELSFNENFPEIQRLYIRFKNSEGSKELLDISDFEDTKKMATCEIILRSQHFKMSEEVQFVGKNTIISNNWSMDSKRHTINFQILMKNENYNFDEFMYPCYTTSTDSNSSSSYSSHAKFWISGGFRPNSIIVYKESINNGYNLIMFVENWDFDKIE